MNVQAIRTPHHSNEQVAEILAAALADLERLDPPEDLRAAVFTEACRLRGAAAVALLEAPRQAISVPGMRL